MNILLTNIRLTKRGFLATLILLFTFPTWYYVFSFSLLWNLFGSDIVTFMMPYAIFNFIIVITLAIGCNFVTKINTIHLLYGSSIVISISTPLLFFSNTIITPFVIFIDAVFFSLGQLSSLMYFWSHTVNEERGRAAGLAGLFSLPIFQVLALMTQTLDFSGILLTTVIISLGTLSIKLLKPEKKVLLTTMKDQNGYRPEKRTIFFYSIPWILFSLINLTLARNISIGILNQIPSTLYMSLIFLQAIAAGFGALIGGFMADFLGRRLSLSLGLTLYGISAALAGFVPIPEVLFFVYVANGLNWGILWVLYGPVVWGDLSDKRSYAKVYSIGLAIFYLASGLGFLLTPQISQISLLTSSLLSCILIFLSNVPLLLAPELLPADFRERVKLKLHMNVVKKIGKKQKDQG